MVMDYRAIEGDGNLQMFNLGRSVEELPVLVRLDLVIPTKAGDRVATGEERVTDHVAPTGFADAFVFATMHPDPSAIHQRAEKHRSAASALPNSQNVEVVLNEPLVDSIEM